MTRSGLTHRARLPHNRGIAERVEPFIQYHLRAVRAGVLATWIVLPLLAVYPWLPGHEPVERGPYLVVLGIALAGLLVVQWLPWERLFRSGWGDRFRYAWSVVDIVLITLALGFADGAASPLFGLYALTTVFFAASYPLRGQVALLAFTAACYLLLAVAATPVDAGEVGVRLGILATLGFMGSFLSRELITEMTGHAAARAEADRRAQLLGAVVGSGPRMSVLDHEGVLAAVADAALQLGFDAADVCLLDEGQRGTYRVVEARGLPSEYADRKHDATSGVVGRVLAEQRTVVSDDYGDLPDAVDALRSSGFLAVVGTPVWVQGGLAAVLEAGTRSTRSVAVEEIEALELLAYQAGRAIENAQRFDAERKMVERLEELDRLKGEFVSTASHELRTPLTIIVGMASTLVGKWDTFDEGDRRNLMERLLANAERLDDLVSALLDFSRLDAGRIRLDLGPVDLGGLVAEATHRLESLFEHHHVSVEIDPAVVVEADDGLVDRVIENLLTNAVRHTPPGTCVAVRVAEEDGEGIVSVEDDGPGVPPEVLGHLGERFYRGEDASRNAVQGLGLGLALSLELLQLHGSDLEIVSELGAGTMFRFRLPVSQMAEEPSRT